MTKNTLKKCIFLCFIVLLSAMTIAAREKLYIFYPSTLDHRSMQDSIAKDLKGVSVTAFGRYETFIEKVRTDQPNGVITLKLLSDNQLNDYEIRMTGKKNGSLESNYIILSTLKPLDPESIDDKTVIGVTDILGRKDMKLFLKGFFPAVPKFKRVPKVADLLSMLSFNAVSGIMIQDVFLDYFKSTSQLEFFTSQLPATPDGALVFAVHKKKIAKKTSLHLKKNSKTIRSLLFTDEWK